MIDESMFGDPAEGKLDPMAPYTKCMTINGRLEAIREFARELRRNFIMIPNNRNPEILGMVKEILDRVMQIENEIGADYGRDKKAGS